MTCNCIGGNPCPCRRGGMIGSIVFSPIYSGAAPQVPTPELADLIAKARLHVMTPQEQYEQKVSWIYGMLPFDSKTTKEEIKAHLAAMGVVEPSSAASQGSAKENK